MTGKVLPREGHASTELSRPYDFESVRAAGYPKIFSCRVFARKLKAVRCFQFRCFLGYDEVSNLVRRCKFDKFGKYVLAHDIC